MKKIIERGPETFVTTCRHCGTKFSYELEDLWSSSFSPTPYVQCPVCSDRCYHYIPNTDETSTTTNTSGYVVVDDTLTTNMSKEELEDKYKELKDKVSGSILREELIDG